MKIRRDIQHTARKAVRIRRSVQHTTLPDTSPRFPALGHSVKDIKFCSGFGATQTDKNGPLPTLTWNDVTCLVDCPQDVDKPKAQWLIPSTLLKRQAKAQEAEGEYWMLWADIDESPPTIAKLAETIEGLIKGCCFEIYTTKSATVGKPKSRVLIPLDQPLNCLEWQLCQQALNDELKLSGIKPDISNEKSAQLLFLPNRGEHYEVSSNRTGPYFDPLEAFSSEVAAKKKGIEAKELAVADGIKNAQLKRSERLTQGFESPIDAFNAAYPVEGVLLQAGYDQRGDQFRHPSSESGSFSASVKDKRVHALSSTDPLNTHGNGAHDAFSAFTVLFHNGDTSDAIKEACESLLNGWNEDKEMSANINVFDDGESPLEQLRSLAANGNSKVMKQQMLDDKFVLAGIALLGQWTTIYAAPSSGKTLLTLKMLIQQVVAGEIIADNIHYVNADDNFKGAVEKLELLEPHAIRKLIPNQKGFSVDEFTKLMTDLIAENQAMGQIIVLDTLKKFTDLMDKKASTGFGKLARAFVGVGGTIITLAHTNKNRNEDGGRVFGGTSDIVDDCDCAYILDVTDPDANNKYRVTFTNIKSRGNVEQKVTFTFSKPKGCTYADLLNSVERLDGLAVEESNRAAGLSKDIEADAPTLTGLFRVDSAYGFARRVCFVGFYPASTIRKRTDLQDWLAGYKCLVPVNGFYEWLDRCPPKYF